MKKWFVFLCLLSVCLFYVNSAASRDQDRKETIRVWSFLNPEASSPRDQALRSIIDRFENENPGIKVEVQPQPWQDMYSLFLAAHQTGTAPDLIWLNQAVMNQRPDVLADLDELVFNNWPDEKVQAFPTELWEFGKLGGNSVKAVPIWPTAEQIMFYRKDLYQLAGVEGEIETWYQFADVMRTLNDLGESGRKFYAFGAALEGGTAPGFFDSAIVGLMGKMFDPETKLPLWDTPEALEAFTFFVDLVNEGVIPKDIVPTTTDDLTDAFAAGQYAAASGIAARYSTVLANATFDPEKISFQSFPAWSQGAYPGPVVATTWWLGMWAGSENKENASKLLEAMVDDRGALDWMLIGGQNPMRNSDALMKDSEFMQEKYDDVRKMAEIVSASAFLNPPDVIYDVSARRIINRAFSSVILGMKEPEQALIDAVEEYRQMID